MKLRKITALAVATVFLFTGCGSNNNQNNAAQAGQTEGPNAENTQNGSAASTTSPDATNQPVQSVVSEYYLSMGTLDKEVVIEGDNRDRDEVEIDNGKIIFPRGTIRTVVVKGDTEGEQFVNASEKEVKNLISTIEKAEWSTVTEAPQNLNKETVLVYQTSDREPLTIFIQSIGNDNHLLRMKEDDRDEYSEIEDISDRDSRKDYDVVQIHSAEVTKILKNWMK